MLTNLILVVSFFGSSSYTCMHNYILLLLSP